MRRGRTLVLATPLRTSPFSQRAKPDLAIWAHQVRQISSQTLEAYRRGYRNQRSSHRPHNTLYSDYVSCSRAHSAVGHRIFGPPLLRCVPVDKNLGLVEAQNFVPYIWAPGTEGASGATGYFGSM